MPSHAERAQYPESAGEAEAAAQQHSTLYAWWVVVVLAAGLTLSLADRLILGLMIAPIKRDLALSNTQIGLLQGLAFTAFYVLAGLPMGMIADRGSRRGLAAASVIAWSLMTGACGLAHSFGQLFVARLGVGVGEAGLSPAAISMICDYFPRNLRARPLAFLSIGATAGAGLALMTGGLVVQAIGASGRIELPVLGEVFGWQAVLLLLGATGILFSGVFLSVREPVRSDRAASARVEWMDVLRFIGARRAYFLCQCLGPAFSVLTLVAFHSWMPSLLMEQFNWNAAQAGMGYGACTALAGVAGILLGGWAAQVGTLRGDKCAPLTIAAWAAVVGFIPLVLAPLQQKAGSVLAMLWLGETLLVMPAALAPAMLQSVCPNEVRGRVFSVYLLVISSIGYILGPLGVAALADHAFAGQGGVKPALSLVAAIAITAAALCLMAGRREHRHLLMRAS